MKKTDNNKLGGKAKIKIRQSVLDLLGGDSCSVLDVFCGIDGVMHDAVWHAAKHYAGIDLKIDFRSDSRRRYVGDNDVFVKHLDLQKYNVFDVDAYGNLWGILEIIANRRKWEKGEKGAIVLTDCDMRPNKSHLVMGLRHHPKLGECAFDLHAQALSNWMARCSVRMDKKMEAKIINPTPPRWYCGVVFTAT